MTIYLRDARNIDVFYASMVRLGLPPVRLDAGERRTFTVHLKLHLAGGAFLVGIAVYSYGREIHAQEDAGSDPDPFRIHDDRFPLGTLLIDSPRDVGGLANLYPEIWRETAPAPDGFPNHLGQPTLEVESRSLGRSSPAMLTDFLGNGPAGGDGCARLERANDDS